MSRRWFYWFRRFWNHLEPTELVPGSLLLVGEPEPGENWFRQTARGKCLFAPQRPDLAGTSHARPANRRLRNLKKICGPRPD